MNDLWSQSQGSRCISVRASRRRFGRFLSIAALAGFCLLTTLATSAQAATVSLYAAPAAAGTADCSSPANACLIATAVANANAAAVADSVQIKLAKGNYLLSAPTPTALPVTFAGPSLSFEALSGTPTLSGTKTVRLLSVSAASNVTIDGLEFEFGLAAGLGGAIENSGVLTVRNSTFSSNTAGNGGAISNSGAGTLAIQSSTFSHNSTTGVGGGAVLNSGKATIERSAFINNTAPTNGGGINNQPTGTLTLTGSTIANNTSISLGGGLANLGTLRVQSSTIADNTASGGSAIATGNTNVTFAATIVAAQSSGIACATFPIVDGGYNLDTDGTCISPTSPAAGSHNGTTAYGASTYGAVLDAYLADSLAYNGGPTKTLALLSSPSPTTTLADPALDVVPASFNLPAPVGGIPTACSLPDQRGVPRFSPCDIGAFELPPIPPPPPAVIKPALTALKLKPKKLRNGQKATISFKLDISAEVTFGLKRKVRKHGKKKAKLVKSGGAPKSFTAPAGSVKRTWKPNGLTPGTYQLLATPAGGSGKAISFKILAKRG